MDDNDFFASIAKEGSDPFSQLLDTQEETPADSQPENVDVEDQTSSNSEVANTVPEEAEE